jgi:CRISPR-associated exonuclease Cas4
MYFESDLISISALPHLVYCERRCALVHIEQAWSENRFTAEGRIMRERVHEQDSESRGDVYIVRGLKLRSLALGLTGVADVVEFHRVEIGGVKLSGKKGLWQPFPVEYKRGKPKKNTCDEVQLCGQAMCLEEMLGITIGSGALYYGSQHKQHDVEFGPDLRGQTRELAGRLHTLMDSGRMPPAVYEKKCDNCSLLDMCMPEAGRGSVRKYLDEVLGPIGSVKTSPLASGLPLSHEERGANK